MDLAIIGLGNWGSSLAHGCVAANIPMSEVVVRRGTRSRTELPVVRFEDAKLDARILWLCVRDGEISDVAERIVAHRGHLSGQIVVHSSGALNVRALEAAKRVGAHVASIAPVMSFPTRTPVSLKGVMFAVEATTEIRRQLEGLVRRLGGEPFQIESNKKPTYHAAATLASPLLLSEISAAMATARLAGLPPKQAARWVSALAQATLTNFVSRGAEKSFSGPFARGDAATIRLHLQSLGEHPMLKEIYGSLARFAVEEFSVQRRRELKSLFKRVR
ncbi:MAG TPA: Rossmann-like and DUF2520 domain-containing protein [Pseudacidobacterium sp.]|nr:Rossmann-like and DUF2520 domain-containing protein [Pseudacidobacterium sp.]